MLSLNWTQQASSSGAAINQRSDITVKKYLAD